MRKHGISDSEIYECAMFGVLPPVVTISHRVDEVNEEKWNNYVKMSEEIAKMIIEVGGTCSGGHGLGFRRLNDYVSKELGPAFNLMKGIKQFLDPNFIMNPGKLGLGPNI